MTRKRNPAAIPDPVEEAAAMAILTETAVECEWRSLFHSFVRESWKIEGLSPADKELGRLAEIHRQFIAQPELSLPVLVELVAGLEPRVRLRDIAGLDVRVGNHVAPRGGPMLARSLEMLLADITGGELSPFAGHTRYEYLHPFTDYNGRSGRAIWLWATARNVNDSGLRTILRRGFLHQFYYETLGDYEQRTKIF